MISKGIAARHVVTGGSRMATSGLPRHSKRSFLADTLAHRRILQERRLWGLLPFATVLVAVVAASFALPTRDLDIVAVGLLGVTVMSLLELASEMRGLRRYWREASEGEVTRKLRKRRFSYFTGVQHTHLLVASDQALMYVPEDVWHTVQVGDHVLKPSRSYDVRISKPSSA